MAREMEIDDRAFQQMVRAAANAVAVDADVMTVDEYVERYWGATEYGSRRGQRPWPNPRKKTTLGPGGRVFSKQAVGGWIRKYGKRFLDFLEEAYMKRARGGDPPTQNDLRDSVNEAGRRTLEWMEKTAPVDSGRLRDSLALRKAR